VTPVRRNQGQIGPVGVIVDVRHLQDLLLGVRLVRDSHRPHQDHSDDRVSVDWIVKLCPWWTSGGALEITGRAPWK